MIMAFIALGLLFASVQIQFSGLVQENILFIILSIVFQLIFIIIFSLKLEDCGIILAILMCLMSNVITGVNFKAKNAREEQVIEQMEQHPSRPVSSKLSLPPEMVDEVHNKQIGYWEKAYKPLSKEDEEEKQVDYVIRGGMRGYSDNLGGTLSECSVKVTTYDGKKVDGKLSINKKTGEIRFQSNSPEDEFLKIHIRAKVKEQKEKIVECLANLEDWDETMNKLQSEFGKYEVVGAKKVNNDGDYILQIKPEIKDYNYSSINKLS